MDENQKDPRVYGALAAFFAAVPLLATSYTHVIHQAEKEREEAIQEIMSEMRSTRLDEGCNNQYVKVESAFKGEKDVPLRNFVENSDGRTSAFLHSVNGYLTSTKPIKECPPVENLPPYGTLLSCDPQNYYWKDDFPELARQFFVRNVIGLPPDFKEKEVMIDVQLPTRYVPQVVRIGYDKDETEEDFYRVTHDPKRLLTTLSGPLDYCNSNYADFRSCDERLGKVFIYEKPAGLEERCGQIYNDAEAKIKQTPSVHAYVWKTLTDLTKK